MKGQKNMNNNVLAEMENNKLNIVDKYKLNGITREEVLKLMQETNEKTNGDEMLKRNAVGLVRNGVEKCGKLFVEISLDYLKVDDSYQRPYDKKHSVKDLVEKWNYMAFDALKVNYRGDGYFYVMDGQHRKEAAKILGIEFLLCEVIVGLTVEMEAELFGGQGNGIKKPKAYDIFKANVRSGEKIDSKIKLLCDEHHLIVDSSRVASHLSCLSLARRMIKNKREEDFKWMLHILDKVGYNTYFNGHSFAIMRPLEEIIKCYKNDMFLLESKIVELLSCFTPNDLIYVARKIHPEESHPADEIGALFKGFMKDNYDISYMQKELSKLKENIVKKKNENIDGVNNKVKGIA